MEENTEMQENNQHERTFTQEEVNRIVQERLARVKHDQNKDPEEAEKDKGEDEKEKTIALRENRVECREFVAEKGYNRELLDILDTSDAEKFKSQSEKIVALFTGEKEKKVYPGTKQNTIRYDQHNEPFPNAKHIPKQYLGGL